MQRDPRFEYVLRSMRQDGKRELTWLQKAGGVLAALTFFALAIMFSVVFFAFALTAGLAAGAYFWWKTRKLRKAMRETPPEGLVIEGEIIREVNESDTGNAETNRNRH